MALDTSAPTNVITPPGGDIKVKTKTWLTNTATTQSNAFMLRKGSSIVKLEAQVESTNATSTTVALAVGSPTTTNHYVNAFALSTNAVAQQLVGPLTNIATNTELTVDTVLTAQIGAAPQSGKIVLNLYYID